VRQAARAGPCDGTAHSGTTEATATCARMQRSAATREARGDVQDGARPARAELARIDVPRLYPPEYRPSAESPPEVEGPHERPATWAGHVNEDRAAPGRDINCGECARAVQRTWEGDPHIAAAMAEQLPGEPIDRMADWASQWPQDTTMTQVGERLTELGPGSSAIVGCDWKGGGGHWFNAVNHDGTVTAVDGQSSRTEAWPPSVGGLGYDESRMRHSDAIFFDAGGRIVR
jgi:hypothetical protein